MSAPYQAVWFDLDGTLLDTAPDLIAAVNRALVQHGHAPAPPEVILPYAGHGSRAMLRHALAAEADDPRLPALQDAFYADYLQHIADHTRWFPGMERPVGGAGSARRAVGRRHQQAGALHLRHRPPFRL